ncbi:MAG: hypothetical protein RJB68_1, partial [Pseudomonadota bacterium]
AVRPRGILAAKSCVLRLKPLKAAVVAVVRAAGVVVLALGVRRLSAACVH